MRIGKRPRLSAALSSEAVGLATMSTYRDEADDENDDDLCLSEGEEERFPPQYFKGRPTDEDPPNFVP